MHGLSNGDNASRVQVSGVCHLDRSLPSIRCRSVYRPRQERPDMTIALVLFALAALGGVTMAVIRFRGADRPPTGLALLHGALAAAGIIVLIVALLNTTTPAQARTALVVFIIAALVGFYLLTQHFQK